MNGILQGPSILVIQLALGFVAGVLLVQQLPVLPPGWVLVLPALGTFFLWRRNWPGAAALLAGLAWAMLYGVIRLQDGLTVVDGRQEALVEGHIVSIPEAMDRGWRFDFAIDRVIEPKGGRLPARVRLNSYAIDEPVRAGQVWRWRISLRPPHGMVNPGGFDYEGWLFGEGIRALGYVREARVNHRIADIGGPVTWLPAWRQGVHDQLAGVLKESPVRGLVIALTMGSESDITPEQWKVLRRTGTAHLIAISGSHIGLVAAFVFFLVRRACARLGVMRWSPPRVAAVAGLLAAVLYSALAGFSLPTQRAMIMVSVTMGAILLQRHVFWPHVLALALLLVTAFDPLAVLSPGFWLSFGAVALIGYTISGRVAAPAGWRAMLRINGVTALGLAPLLLLFFGQVSIISPLANLLAVPLLGTLLVPVCLLGALLLPVFSTAGGVLIHLAETLLIKFWPVLGWMSGLPLSQWSHAMSPAWTIALAGLGVVMLLAPRGMPGRWLGAVLLLPAILYEPVHPDTGRFRFTLLDVGQGLATVVETRHHTLVFDTGARFGPGFDMGSAVVEPYLRQRGIGRLDTLVISHGDNDHIGGSRSLLDALPVESILTSVPESFPGQPVGRCEPGQQWSWDGVAFDMLGPSADHAKENNDSCILKVSAPGGSVLLTGDVEQEGEQALVNRHGERLHSDVLVVPHHGSKTSSTPDFLHAVSPRVALIPAGYLNRYGFPHRVVVERYKGLGIPLMNTADSGAISFETGDEAGQIQPVPYRLDHARYWLDR